MSSSSDTDIMLIDPPIASTTRSRRATATTSPGRIPRRPSMHEASEEGTGEGGMTDANAKRPLSPPESSRAVSAPAPPPARPRAALTSHAFTQETADRPVVTRVAAQPKSNSNSKSKSPMGLIERLERNARAENGLPPREMDDSMDVDDDSVLMELKEGGGQRGVGNGGQEQIGQRDEEEEAAEDGGDEEEEDEDEDEEDEGEEGESGESEPEDAAESGVPIAPLQEGEEEAGVGNQTNGDIDITMEEGPTLNSEAGIGVPPEPDPEEDDDKATTDGSDTDEDRPKPRKPMPTIRLEFSIKQANPVSETALELSICLLAKQAGYDLPEDTAITHGASTLPEAERPPTPPPAPAPDPNAPLPKQKRKRRILERDEGYDQDDPFVDDSEAQVTEPKFYYPPARDGYYVAQGPLVLKEAKRARGRKTGSKNKPKMDSMNGTNGTNGHPMLLQPHHLQPAAGPSNYYPHQQQPTSLQGTRLAPFVLEDDDRPNLNLMPRFQHSTAHTPRATSLPPAAARNENAGYMPFDVYRAGWPALLKTPKVREPGNTKVGDELEEAIVGLKKQVDAAMPFPPKKFPQHLKPLTINVAMKAIDLREYDDVFFVRIAEVFPYNTFTIKKLIKKEILPTRKAYFETEMNKRQDQLTELAEEVLPAAVAEYEKAMAEYLPAKAAYEARQAAKGLTVNVQGQGTAPEEGGTPASMEAPEMAAVTTDAGDEGGDKPPKEPIKQLKFTPRMREIYYEIIKLDDELGDVIKDTQKIAEKEVSHTDAMARKNLYARLVKLFPEGYVSSHKLSREMTICKKKWEG